MWSIALLLLIHCIPCYFAGKPKSRRFNGIVRKLWLTSFAVSAVAGHLVAFCWWFSGWDTSKCSNNCTILVSVLCSLPQLFLKRFKGLEDRSVPHYSCVQLVGDTQKSFWQKSWIANGIYRNHTDTILHIIYGSLVGQHVVRIFLHHVVTGKIVFWTLKMVFQKNPSPKIIFFYNCLRLWVS